MSNLPVMMWRDTGDEAMLCTPNRPNPVGVERYYTYTYLSAAPIIADIIYQRQNFDNCEDYREYLIWRLSEFIEPTKTEPRYVVDNIVRYDQFNAPFSSQLSMGGLGPCPANQYGDRINGSVAFSYSNSNAPNVATNDQINYRWETEDTINFEINDDFTALSQTQYFPWGGEWEVQPPAGTYSALPPFTDIAPKVTNPDKLSVRIPASMRLDGGLVANIFAPWLDIQGAVDYFMAMSGCSGPTPPDPEPPVEIPGESVHFEFGKYPGSYEPKNRDRIILQNYSVPFEALIKGF